MVTQRREIQHWPTAEEARWAHNAAQAALFNRIADSFLAPIPADIVERTGRIVRLARLRPGDAVLDVGTGTGVMLPYLLRAGAGNIVACDLSAEMLKRARRRFPTGIVFVQRDVVDLTAAAMGRFDRVICNAVFANFHDQRQALVAIRRLLKPRGMLIISHPMGREFVLGLRAQNPDMIAHELPGRAELSKICRATGFRLTKLIDARDLYVALMKPAVTMGLDAP